MMTVDKTLWLAAMLAIEICGGVALWVAYPALLREAMLEYAVVWVSLMALTALLPIGIDALASRGRARRRAALLAATGPFNPFVADGNRNRVATWDSTASFLRIFAEVGPHDLWVRRDPDGGPASVGLRADWLEDYRQETRHGLESWSVHAVPGGGPSTGPILQLNLTPAAARQLKVPRTLQVPLTVLGGRDAPPLLSQIAGPAADQSLQADGADPH